jgi:hypothetical protein
LLSAAASSTILDICCSPMAGEHVVLRWQENNICQESLQLRACIVPNCAVANPIVDRASALGFVLDPQFGVICGGTRDKGEIPRLVVPTLCCGEVEYLLKKLRGVEYLLKKLRRVEYR